MAQPARQNWLETTCEVVTPPAPTRPAIWSPEAALDAEFARIDAAVPASGKWRPITDSTAPDRGGFNVARIGEDR